MSEERTHYLKCAECGADAHARVSTSLTAETQWCPQCNGFTSHSASVTMVDVFNENGDLEFSAPWNAQKVQTAWESGRSVRKSK